MYSDVSLPSALLPTCWCAYCTIGTCDDCSKSLNQSRERVEGARVDQRGRERCQIQFWGSEKKVLQLQHYCNKRGCGGGETLHSSASVCLFEIYLTIKTTKTMVDILYMCVSTIIHFWPFNSMPLFFPSVFLACGKKRCEWYLHAPLLFRESRRNTKHWIASMAYKYQYNPGIQDNISLRSVKAAPSGARSDRDTLRRYEIR